VLAPWVDGRDAGSHAVALDEGLVADFDTGDVGDGVVEAGGAAVLQSDGAGARFAGWSGEVRVVLTARGAHGHQGSSPGCGCFLWPPVAGLLSPARVVVTP
jgi:hypothetical protein